MAMTGWKASTVWTVPLKLINRGSMPCFAAAWAMTVRMRGNLYAYKSVTSIPVSVFWLHHDQSERFCPQHVRVRHPDERRFFGVAGHHTRVTATRSHMSYQRSKAMNRQTVQGQPLGGFAGPDHIDPIQKLLFLDRIPLASPLQALIADRQGEVFGHLVTVDDLVCSHADLGRLLGRTARARHVAASAFSWASVAARSSWRLCRRCSANWGL
jgi:hypothetical protein